MSLNLILIEHRVLRCLELLFDRACGALPALGMSCDGTEGQ